MLPASEYSLERWKNTSTSWSSSRIATFVSWRFAEITNSLLMKTPCCHGENPRIKEKEGESRPSIRRVIHWTVFPDYRTKIFWPIEAEMPFSYTQKGAQYLLSSR